MVGQRDTSPPPAAPVTNWERQCVTLAGYCYAVRHGMKVQLVTPYSVSLLQRYGVTVRGNVRSVYPPLRGHESRLHSHDRVLRYAVTLQVCTRLNKRQTSMPPVGFEPAIPAGGRLQTYVLDRAATGIGCPSLY